ncbi:hypothetical protein [Lacisediminihabitans changchengi]|uniref:DUF4430 domain-containing protein n=1 Tax=Lacisediminihabitans changchengi TaxID=2787634 RepID=A0A934SST3_9MICO|nr:hypothetical protein [Lacisediminihabitans changchengi]MBK4348290.1 hypothetical protein [Lacisediminihabitans changchengi]
MRRSLVETSIVAGGIAALLLLSGCSSSGTAKASGPAPSQTTTAAPSASPTAAAPKDVLFTIAANVRGKDGATIGIQMTVHKAVAYNESAVKPLETEFIKSCGAGVGGNPVTTDTLEQNGSVLVPIDIASSVTGKPFVSPVQLALGSPYFGQAASGKGITPTDSTQPCYGGYNWATAGTAHAVADFESGSPAPDPKLWRYAFYGFGVAYESDATIEACKITLTDLATSEDVASVDGWDPKAPQSGTSCGIGYTGE